jgi:hypothetical protein
MIPDGVKLAMSSAAGCKQAKSAQAEAAGDVDRAQRRIAVNQREEITAGVDIARAKVAPGRQPHVPRGVDRADDHVMVAGDADIEALAVQRVDDPRVEIAKGDPTRAPHADRVTGAEVAGRNRAGRGKLDGAARPCRLDGDRATGGGQVDIAARGRGAADADPGSGIEPD